MKLIAFYLSIKLTRINHKRLFFNDLGFIIRLGFLLRTEILSVSKRMVSIYLGDIDKQIREDRKETIRSMYLQCYTAEEIAEIVGLSHPSIVQEIQVLSEMEMTSKTYKTTNFQDDFDPPIYNRFSYGKVTNVIDHFGYSK